MPQDPALRRQWKILQLIGSGPGKTINELAELMAVNQKTIRRDIDQFRDLGFDLEECTESFNRKRWRIRTNLPKLEFSFDEAVVLLVSRQLADRFEGSSVSQAAKNAYEKLKNYFGPMATQYLEKLSRDFLIADRVTGDYTAKDEIIDTLTFATEDQKEVELTYKTPSAEAEKTFVFHPYAQIQYQHGLFWVGYVPHYQHVRLYKVDRMRDAVALPSSFQKPAGFDPMDYFRSAFGIIAGGDPQVVRVRFTDWAAVYVAEARWHPDQQIENQSDGAIIWTVSVGNFRELKLWILQFGRFAQVLSPTSLIDEIRAEAAAILNNYHL